MDKVERIARVLCARAGRDPDALEPGNICVQTDWSEKKLQNGDYDGPTDRGEYPADGHDGKDQCHFSWREYIFTAQAFVAALEN